MTRNGGRHRRARNEPGQDHDTPAGQHTLAGKTILLTWRRRRDTQGTATGLATLAPASASPGVSSPGPSVRRPRQASGSPAVDALAADRSSQVKVRRLAALAACPRLGVRSTNVGGVTRHRLRPTALGESGCVNHGVSIGSRWRFGASAAGIPRSSDRMLHAQCIERTFRFAAIGGRRRGSSLRDHAFGVGQANRVGLHHVWGAPESAGERLRAVKRCSPR